MAKVVVGAMMVRRIDWSDSYDVCPDTGCWMWSKGVDHWGYGKKRHGKKMAFAHRISYEAHNGTVWDDMVIMHTCDTPACVNPEHLVQGTNKDNARDASAKGRMVHGERHRSAKLTEEQVVSMRRERAAGATVTSLARKYGVGTANVSLTCTGRKWKHAGGPISKPSPTGPLSGRSKQ